MTAIDAEARTVMEPACVVRLRDRLGDGPYDTPEMAIANHSVEVFRAGDVREVCNLLMALLGERHATTPDTAHWHSNNDWDEQEAKQ